MRAPDRSRTEGGARRKSRRRSAIQRRGRRIGAGQRGDRRESSLFRQNDFDAVFYSVGAFGHNALARREAVGDFSGGLVAAANSHLALACDVAGSNDEYFEAVPFRNQSDDRDRDGSRVYARAYLTED